MCIPAQHAAEHSAVVVLIGVTTVWFTAAWQLKVRKTRIDRHGHHAFALIAASLERREFASSQRFGCFGSDPFRAKLKALPGNRNTVLLCGMEAHICVMQTALGALNAGYLVHVASDAVGARAEWNWKVGLERMKAAGAVISSTEMMIYELLRCSGTPAFKELLQYLK